MDKFTSTGHVRVVAKGSDIGIVNNPNGELVSSVVLTEKVGQLLDDSFVMIFPLTPDILNLPLIKDYADRNGMIELAIGNYLISKGVPIIDYGYFRIITDYARVLRMMSYNISRVC